MKTTHSALITLLLLAISTPLFAFNGHRVEDENLILEIKEVPTVTEYGIGNEVKIEYTITNKTYQKIRITPQFLGAGGGFNPKSRSGSTSDILPQITEELFIHIRCSQTAYSALYPIHVIINYKQNGKAKELHAVRIVKVDLTNTPKVNKTSSSLTEVPKLGVINLTHIKNNQVTWKKYDGPIHTMPIGWTGSDETSGTWVAVQSMTRGDNRQAIGIHPPWRNGGGSAFVTYHLILPDVKPITLSFGNAIRDTSATEPSSDGVTFRVWVEDTAGKSKVFETHTDAKIWKDSTVDLSAYAGKEIKLSLESHPGPNHNTTCDASYWCDPSIMVGEPPVFNNEEQAHKQHQLAIDMVRNNKKGNNNTALFQLDDNYRAALVLGPNGIFDGSLAIGNDNSTVLYKGFNVSINSFKAGYGTSGIRVTKTKIRRLKDSQLEINQELMINGKATTLTADFVQNQAGLQISFSSPERITDLSLGQTDQLAHRIYYGHGYCVENPKAFQASFGGHNLSTSHVGFDFESGLSIVTTCDNPPDRLIVSPDSFTYALHTHMNATLTIVPSDIGAFDAARRYRPLYDKVAAPAFKNKAGRFVYDIWGGRYANHTQQMQKLIDYGLTDSLLTLHVWQRWGYDYRLPDIYPPDPGLGTVEDMQGLSELCRKHNIPWGLHDNYIDFYPDAQGYDYKHIAFTEGGQPIKAWINTGRDAQSYRWRPDHIMPFVKRNLKPIKDNLQPTHYFIDVFTSIDMFDFYDYEGKFHSFLETRKHWGEAFAYIRDTLGHDAPMTSEAGDDQLVGYIEGADCQFLRLTSQPEDFTLHVPYEDWERVPWFDMVLHDKFSLHGVGYSGRYQGGLDREMHGIMSDDYISAEMLTGHAMMTDWGSFDQGSVRKYYLGQDFIRSIAEDTIKNVTFVEDDIHRQKIEWNSGATVYVNRSASDWPVAGKVLPENGYFAKSGKIESSIEVIDGITVEQSKNDGVFFVNGRGYGNETQLNIEPRVNRVESLGGGKYKLVIDWQVDQAGPKDASVFVHFVGDGGQGSEKIAFQGDFRPKDGLDKWLGKVTTGEDRVLQVPSHIEAGTYEIYVGIWDKAVGRYQLRGNTKGQSRCLLGKLKVEKNGNSFTNISLVDVPEAVVKPRWGNIAKREIDFGVARTSGAFRCEIGKDSLVIIPLPELKDFDIELDLAAICGKGVAPKSFSSLDIKRNDLGHHQHQYENGILKFRTRKDVFGYKVAF